MDFSFLQGTGDTANASTYTYSSQNLGTADSARYIIVCFEGRGNAGALTISSVTVAGISATQVVHRENNTALNSVAAIYIAAVPTGTTGDVVVTLANSALRSAIQLYRAVDIDSATATDTDSDITTGAPSMSLDVPAGGFAVGAGTVSNTTTCSWTGLTEDYDANVEVITVSSASDEFASAQTGLAVTASFASGSTSAGVVASWAPGAGGGGGAASRLTLLGVG